MGSSMDWIDNDRAIITGTYSHHYPKDVLKDLHKWDGDDSEKTKYDKLLINGYLRQSLDKIDPINDICFKFYHIPGPADMYKQKYTKCSHMGCRCQNYKQSQSKWSKGKCHDCNHPDTAHMARN